MSLSGGVAAALGSVLVAGATAPRGRRAAYVIAGGASAAAGAYDDLVAPRWERPGDKGGRGHLQALRQARPSGGVVKVALIVAGALAASMSGPSGRRASWSSRLVEAALVASTANLVNLFDLRPGRAAKVVVIAGGFALFGAEPTGAAGALGAAAAALPGDLGERYMLGDTGANPLGAVLGLSLAAGGPRRRLTVLAVILALTAASERISFSAVIASVPALRAFDDWGRGRADGVPGQ